MPPIAIILNGASSSGKTSIANAMQDLWPVPLIHASLDTFTDVFRWSAIKDEADSRECHEFGVASFHEYLARIASSRFPIVVDHVLEQPAWYESTLAAVNSRQILVVAIRCAIEVLENREKHRGNRRVGMARWQHHRIHEGKRYDLEVDTASMSSLECAALIMEIVRGR